MIKLVEINPHFIKALSDNYVEKNKILDRFEIDRIEDQINTDLEHYQKKDPQVLLALQFRITFGKYKGEFLGVVATFNKQYLQWVLDNTNFDIVKPYIRIIFDSKWV